MPVPAPCRRCPRSGAIGRGGIADVASVLEVFRRLAPEARRLILVEKRADELEGKDERLDDALADLYRVPHQIVRQVLPDAPGELTAGGVHEMRNPLNLVQNFPDGSEELCASNGRNNEDPAAIAYETAGGLTDNLKRFREHGDRANQIVHHMFAMGQRRSR